MEDFKEIDISEFPQENIKEKEEVLQGDVELFKKSIKLSIAAGGLSKTNKFNYKDRTHRERVQKILNEIDKNYGSSSDFDFLACTDHMFLVYDEAADTLFFSARYTEFRLSKRGFKDLAFALFQRVSLLGKKPTKFPKRFQRDADFVLKFMKKPEFQKSQVVLSGFSMGGAEAITIYERVLDQIPEEEKTRIKVIAWNPGGFALPSWIKGKKLVESKERKENIIIFQVEGDFLSDFWEKPGLEYRIKKLCSKKHSSTNFLKHFFIQNE